jgi:hypothetical protein
MKYGYIVYGTLKQDWGAGEDLKKEMERVKEEAEKKGFNMKYWGHPYGVSENIVVVYKSEKGLDAYFNMGVSNPWTGARTNQVIIP